MTKGILRKENVYGQEIAEQCLALLIIREIKTRMRYYLTCSLLAKINNSNTFWWTHWSVRSLTHPWWVYKLNHYFGKQFGFILCYCIIIYLEIQLKYIPKRNFCHEHRKTCDKNVTSSTLCKNKKVEQFKCPVTTEWRDGGVFTHGISHRSKNEWYSFPCHNIGKS